MKGQEAELEMWRDRFARLERERDDLLAELRKTQDALSKLNLDTLSRGSTSRLKMLENDNERLREQLRASMAECDQWRKRALSLELQLFETANRLSDETGKNQLYNFI